MGSPFLSDDRYLSERWWNLMEKDMLWFWLHEARGISRKTKQKMLDYFSSPQEIFFATEEELKNFSKRESGIQQFMASRRETLILNKYEKLRGNGVRFVHMESEDYPMRLRNIPDPPIGLYYKGKLPNENQKTVAIIGARECTRYGSEMARFFGRELSKAGIQVISGLARGIDGMAHTGALEVGGYTLGILGCGIDQIYPEENYKLFMQMKQSGGIMSESGLGEKPYAGLFPQRNRLISGLADGILVVEAMEKSGTFITVDQGLEQGKEVFALPGRNIDVKSRGCNNLIKMGAHLVMEVNDILEIIAADKNNSLSLFELMDLESAVHKNLLAPNEKIVYSCLRVEPQYLDVIIGKAQIAPQEVCMALNHLIILGAAVETTRNYYAVKL